MAYELRDNSGSAFKNQHKETDKHSDFSGTVMVHGEEMWVNIWVKGPDKNGNKWFSFSFKDKGEENRKGTPPEYDQEIPF